MVRNATIDDVSKIESIEKELFADEGYSNAVIESNLSLDNYTTKVIEDNGKVVGYVTVSRVVDEAELLKIAVSKTYQKSGLGSKLILAIESELKDNNIVSIFLEVKANNVSAIAFYERHGYERISVREKYYKDTDAYIYRKRLNSDDT